MGMKKNLLILALAVNSAFAWADNTGNGSNVDDLVYPMTKVCEGNPLFVNFPSPKWGDTKQTGTFYSADPSARVWNIDGKDILYVYCSHDMEPAQGCDHMDRYHIFSTEDMKTWTDHGEIFESKAVNAIMGSGWTIEGFMWAPDCLYNPTDKMYYYYFPHPKGPNWNDSWEIIVAKSDRPDGGFTIQKAISGMPGCIDPNVFLDDDGQIYIYVGGGGEVWGGKLKKDDWTTVDGTMKQMTINGGHFHEGAWVFKKDGLYYLTYPASGGAGGNKMAYATSDSPLGPWTEQGYYMNPHGGDTAHGSVVNFKGKWYQFYHTGNYSGSDVLRSVCVDELTFDGKKINMVRNWGEPKGTLPSVSLSKTVKIEAEDYNTGGSHYGYFNRPENNDISTETADGATYIQEITGNEWVRYSVNVEETGPYAVKVRIKQKDSNNGKFTIAVDGSWVRTNVAVGSDKDKWIEIELDNIYIEQGEHYIEFRGNSGNMQLDWLEMSNGFTKIPGTVEDEDFDRGGEGVAYHWINKNATGHGYRDDANFIESGQGIGWIDNGSWAKYTVNVTKAGKYKLTYWTASANDGGWFNLKWDGKDLWGRLKAPNTGGWTAWTHCRRA